VNDMPNTMIPRRPFGLTLALVVGLLLFVVMPMLQVVFLISLNSTFSAENGIGISGVEVQGLQIEPLILNGSLSLIYLIVVILTAMRRFKWMRLGFPIITLLYTLFYLVPQLTSSNTAITGVDSGQQLTQNFNVIYMVMASILTIYSFWFLNRWSARAFYRGAYTMEEIEILQLDSDLTILE